MNNKFDIKTKTVVLIFVILTLIIFFEALYRPAASPDTISQWFPFTKHRIGHFFKHLDIPLWHPYINGGVPELDVGFPFSTPWILTLAIFANIKTAPAIAYIIIVLLSGIFSFLYFRSLKLNNYIAFLSAIIYMFSGDMISYFYPGHLGKPLVMCLIPLTLLLVDKGFNKKQLLYFPASGILLGFSYLMHPQIFYYFLLYFSYYYLLKLYLLYRQENSFNSVFNGIIWYGLMGLTAMIVSSPTLVQQYFYAKLTSRGTLKNEAQMWDFATSWSHHPLELLTYFIPSIFGLYDATYLGWKPFVQTTDYIGVITIILALIGIATSWKEKITKFNFFALIIMTLFSFGRHFPIYYKLFYNYLPLIKKFRVPASIFLVTTFIITYFAFKGISAILKSNEDKKIRDKIVKIIVIFILLIFAISIWLYTANYREVLKNNMDIQNSSSENMRKINIQGIIQQYGWQGEQHINNIVQKTVDMAKSDMGRMWLWVMLFIIIYFAFVNKKLRAKSFLILLTIVIFLDLYIVDKKFINTVEPAAYDIIDKETPVIKFLKQDKTKFRILPNISHNEVNKWCLFGLESVTGYHAAGLRIYEDIMKNGLLNNINFLSLFNTKYIITTKPINIQNIEKVFQSLDGRLIYKNTQYLPRYFLVDNYLVAENEEQVMSILKQDRIDYAKTIILEENPEIEENISLSKQNNNVRMIKWDTDILKFECKIENPCFLFLSEVFYPKWRAYINGREIKIYKTDYLFRSVFLKKGNYILTLKFHNNGSYLITAIIHYIFSILGIILIVRLLSKG